MRRSMAVVAALVAAVVTGCGDDGGDEDTSAETTTTAAAEEAAPADDGSDLGMPDDEVTTTVEPPECAPLEPAATALVGPGSTVDQNNTFCQFYGQTSASGAGTSWRLVVSGEGARYQELDFESATSAGFESSEGMVEADAPEGWNVAATRTSETPDPDFPEATSQQVLYFGGPEVAGLIRCDLELTARGEPGAAPPAPPAIDQTTFVAFCDAAKEQMSAEAG